MGIGISTFTEIVGAGPSHTFDILGLKMFDSAEIRIHPTGNIIARFGTKSQGQGHETTYAQILAEELGIPEDDIVVEEGEHRHRALRPRHVRLAFDSDCGCRGGGGCAQDTRKGEKNLPRICLRRAKKTLIGKRASSLSRARPSAPRRFKKLPLPPTPIIRSVWRRGLEAVCYYDPPNLTFPFGAYICVVDIDRGTGQVKIRRFVAVDDCGTIINPMIVDGQIAGGLTMGMAPALMEEMVYDENGVNLSGSFTDYLLPTAMETPKWEMDKTVTPSPHHPFGAKGVGESATVGAPPAIANAVVDALSHLGVTNIDIPMTPPKVWAILHREGCSVVIQMLRAEMCSRSNKIPLDKHMNDQLEANKKIVWEYYDLAFNQKKPEEAVARYLGPYYRQHNPGAADGRGTIYRFCEMVRAKVSVVPH